MSIYKYKIGTIYHIDKCDFKMIIGADFVPTNSNAELFAQGNYDQLIGKTLFEYLMETNIRVFNLEVPLTESEEKIQKVGSPALKASTNSVNLFNHLRPLILSGANNHIRDYDEQGILDTKSILEKNDIEYVGFGEQGNIKKIHYVYYNNIKIGIYALAENELSVDEENQCGANGFDIFETFDEISNYKSCCDYLIVLFHGGCENYRFQTPNQQKMCRKFVQKGADIVICQHSHCIGTYEIYNNAMIVYGQGNFLFDRLSIDEWMSSILVEIDFSDLVINVIPIVKKKNTVRCPSKKEAEKIMNDLVERSTASMNESILLKNWDTFVNSQKNVLLLRGIRGVTSPFVLAFNKMTRGKYLDWLFSERKKNLLYNYLRCESIRERILFLLKK